MAAASRCIALQLVPDAGSNQLNPIASRVLRRTMPVRKNANCRCGVHHALSKLLNDTDIPKLRWRRFFRRDYHWAEEQAIECEQLARSNPTAFVNALLVLLDLLLDNLYRIDQGLGQYQKGNIGGVLQSQRLKSAYPKTFALVASVHTQRAHSRLSHAVNRRTGRRTRSIRPNIVDTVKKLFKKALGELSGIL
jgi:hypothetical protein